MLDQTRRLPLFAAMAAFALYVCTLGGGVTTTGLPLTANLAGWDTSPMIGQPLLWLLTLPVRLMPAAWVPLAIKLFAAAMAAAILGLLTRTIQLLPWDHPWATASRWAGALPVLTAGAVCGLEFNFWLQATSNCGELLDLLLLAVALWLLLEYRVRQISRWLDAAAVVWGLGMAQNWLMALTLPLFVAGVIWLLGLRFFRWKTILRLAGLGLAGFSVYVVLPMADGLAPHSPWTLGHAWIATLKETRDVILLPFHFWRGNRLLTIAVVLFFLAPTLPLVVRLHDEGTQNKSGVDRFQIWLYRGLRAALLLGYFWLAFDPLFGARQMMRHDTGKWMPMLTLDYLNALAAGFLLGNLLLISYPVAGHDEYRRSRTRFRWGRLAVPLATASLVVAALGLAVRNAPAIVRLNFHPVEDFGTQALNSLPAGGGVVLSDFPEKLCAFQAALAHRHESSEWLAINTRTLPTAAYRAQLERRQPDGWLTDQNQHDLTPNESVRLLEQVARTNRLFYLHPSYGYFFEKFYLEPAGTIYEMKLRGKDPLVLPPMPEGVIKTNEDFWTDSWNRDLAGLVQAPARPGYWQRTLAHYGLTPAPRSQDVVLAEWYSIPLEGWAVRLQQQGRLPEAHLRLVQALQLNTNNISARFSLVCNTNLQTGARMGLSDADAVLDHLGNLDRLNLIVDNDGPFDEPTAGYLRGTFFLDHGLLVEAAEQLERVRALIPGTMAPEMALAEIYNRLQMTDRSRPLIDHLREESRKLPANSSLDLNLAMLESYSWLLQTNRANAQSALHSVVQQHPDDPQIASRVLSAYLALGDLTNALRLADAQLARMPDDAAVLNDKAVALIEAGRATEAIPLLDHVLTLTNQTSARLNRAFAQIAKENFAPAETDLRELEQEGKASPMVHWGLAFVAQSKHDTNLAVQYLRLCLTNTPAGSPLWQQASARLRTLTPATTTK